MVDRRAASLAVRLAGMWVHLWADPMAVLRADQTDSKSVGTRVGR